MSASDFVLYLNSSQHGQSLDPSLINSSRSLPNLLSQVQVGDDVGSAARPIRAFSSGPRPVFHEHLGSPTGIPCKVEILQHHVGLEVVHTSIIFDDCLT